MKYFVALVCFFVGFFINTNYLVYGQDSLGQQVKQHLPKVQVNIPVIGPVPRHNNTIITITNSTASLYVAVFSTPTKDAPSGELAVLAPGDIVTAHYTFLIQNQINPQIPLFALAYIQKPGHVSVGGKNVFFYQENSYYGATYLDLYYQDDYRRLSHNEWVIYENSFIPAAGSMIALNTLPALGTMDNGARFEAKLPKQSVGGVTFTPIVNNSDNVIFKVSTTQNGKDFEWKLRPGQILFLMLGGYGYQPLLFRFYSLDGIFLANKTFTRRVELHSSGVYVVALVVTP